jgi:PAS domain S-box-containing protein
MDTAAMNVSAFDPTGQLAFQEVVTDHALVLLDTEGRVASWPPGAARLTGYQADDVIGRSGSVLRARGAGSPEEAFGAALAEAATSGRHEGEAAVPRPDGSRFWARIVTTALRDGDGALRGFAQVLQDLTVMEQSRDVLRRSERYRMAVEASPNALVMVDGAGRIVLVNQQTERLFGYSREELLGQPVEILVPERMRGKHPGYRSQFMAGPPQARAMGAGRDLFGRRKDGAEFPVEIGLNPFETSEGRFVLAAVVDITERKRAEERFRIAVEAAPNAMVMVNAEGRIVLVNAQTERLFGYPREELLGASIEILVPERFRARHPGYRSSFVSSPRSRPMGAGRDLFGVRRDGSEVPIEIGLNPIRTNDGTHVLAAIVDITERKHAEAELRRTAEELTRSNKELAQFAYVASHDLQEPLRAVAGCVELLRHRYQGQLDATADELVTHAVDGAKRMQTLINDLLAYSRLETRGSTFADVDCNEALGIALANLEVAIREAGAVVTNDPLPTVVGDRTQLAQLLQNLVGNALKFRSDRPPKVHVGAEARDGEWVFRVTDNGIGIEPQYFERIFEIFQRLHTQRRYPGTGMGLAICKKIVDRHEGRIWVESTPGEGSTFWFTVPRGRA